MKDGMDSDFIATERKKISFSDKTDQKSQRFEELLNIHDIHRNAFQFYSTFYI